MRARRAALLCLIAGGALSLPAAATAASSLPSGRGVRPGPALLYRAPAIAPQLTNAGIWRAPPTLVSGTVAYRRGELLYQDFLYDDHGARGTSRDPADPRAGGDLFSAPGGTYTYPTDPAYAGNAADMVELRIRALPGATAFRVTLNTMIDPARVGIALALRSSPSPRPFPHGANVVAPAQRFVTVHGSTADIVDAATGSVLGAVPEVRVDRRRRQVEIRVPHSAWNPGRGVARVAAATGLWDVGANRWLIPAAAATRTVPGGAAGLAHPAAFFNVAFRLREPVQRTNDTSALNDPGWWRDRAQGQALARGNLTPFGFDVDFGKLARGVTDDRGVPRTGAMDRILASHTETRQGVDYAPASLCGRAKVCLGELRGRLQPYALYVPRRRPRSGRYGLTLLLHSLTANYNQFLGSGNQSLFGERAPGSLVASPSGRGPDGFYRDAAEADTFEVWADVAARYRLDPSLAAIAGYSMGGFGTFRLATRYPDLFARAQPTVGTIGSELSGGAQPQVEQLASLRWVPVLMWNARYDELVSPAIFAPAAAELARLRYRFESDVFARYLNASLPIPTPNHLQLAVNDAFGPAAAFLGSARVVADPPRVTYVANPALDDARLGLVADHAYWVSGIRAWDRARPGTVDVRSAAFGRGDAPPSALRRGSGTLRGGFLGPRPFVSEKRSWGAAPRTRRRDALAITASNVRALTIDVRRARVSCRAHLNVRTDRPLAVRLAGCRGVWIFGEGTGGPDRFA